MEYRFPLFRQNPLLCVFEYHYLICLCILSIVSLLYFLFLLLLCVDHAMASVNRSLVARVLVEYDVSWPFFQPIWIGEGDVGFWQEVFFERVFAYCASCKYLGHYVDKDYIANPGLCKPNQPIGESKGIVT